MILIGMLHHRKNPEKVIKSYAYASVAKAEGAELLYFSPSAVNFEEKIINGYVYIDGNWQKTRSPFPDVIYNTGSPVELAHSSEIISRLKEEIPFTTNSVGNKMSVYKRLVKAQEFANYLIPSIYIHSTRSFFDFFNYYKKIVFKPVNGHKGRNIVFIERIRDEFHLLVGTENYTYTWDELRKFVSSKIREESYLVQPYINCKTKLGNAYDLDYMYKRMVKENG